MPMYDLHSTQCLGNNQTQVILAALYLTEIVNATLTTIHDDDKYLSDPSQEELTAWRRKKLLKETTEVSLLLSTMNIYANNPGIDRMISDLGKKLHFVIFFHGSDNNTYIDSLFTSLLVHCRRRTSQQSEKVKKSQAKKRLCTSRPSNLRSLDQLYP